MSNNYFKFKQFTIVQDGCAMKVGTDGCLLGGWFDCSKSKKILDIGCGSGLIAIMAAQRCDALVTGIEIDNNAAIQAEENVKNSPWSDRIRIENIDINKYSPCDLFDTIVSNPPYFSETLQSPDPSRAVARHNCSLPHRDLIDAAKRLLTTEGRLALILPADEARRFAMQAVAAGLHLRRRCDVATKPGTQPKRTLSEWSLTSGEAEIELLTLSADDGQRSEQYRRLTEEFYLH